MYIVIYCVYIYIECIFWLQHSRGSSGLARCWRLCCEQRFEPVARFEGAALRFAPIRWNPSGGTFPLFDLQAAFYFLLYTRAGFLSGSW